MKIKLPQMPALATPVRRDWHAEIVAGEVRLDVFGTVQTAGRVTNFLSKSEVRALCTRLAVLEKQL